MEKKSKSKTTKKTTSKSTKQKLISFVVPCYNSQDYMEHCIDTLLPGGEDVEIIIIDDGSKDDTAKIADRYAKEYPNICIAHHQENGGHGEGINQGLKIATGKYFKVLDSDDWVDEEAYKAVLSRIKDGRIDSDLVIMNYVYTYTDGRPNQQINFRNVFPSDRECTWDETKKFKSTQYMTLHNLMYKKEILDKTDIDLPKHVFYEDNLFIYLPLINTKTLYYLDVDFYRYFIGRADQSVQEPQLIKRSSHQVLVSKLVATAYDATKVENKRLRENMIREAALLMSLGSIFSRLSKTPEGEEQYKKLWQDVKEGQPNMYKVLKRKPIAFFARIPGRLGRFIAIKGYRIAHCLVKFN
jgi:glycosyltransferase involved in cell wall biosynthesis